ncbi:STAS domain-containing protein [Streptomyces sp. NPDC003393]
MHTQLTPESDNQIDHYGANGWTVVSVTGDVDLCSSPVIRDVVIRLVDEGHRHFVLDLRQVPFLDSMGLGMVVAITKRIRAHAGSLLLTCTDRRVRKVFKAGGLHSVYAFHDSVHEATREAPRGSGLAGWPRSRG